MKFLSVCSGIEAASVAWAPLGWKLWAVAEIDAFPATVLHHHYGTGRPHHMPSPDADDLTQEQRDERALAITRVARLPLRTLTEGPVNFGDMTAYKEWPDASLDVLCGGTPCQSFSNAGLRAGLDDPRGQLMLTFGAIAARYRPDWLVWENVPGVLSSNGGRDFGAFLGLLGFLGYGFAYRVLDAQFVRVDGHGRAVPQRRNRVFVVGCLGDWRSAAAVLLERESLRGDPAPRRQAGSRVAATLTRGAESSGKGGYAGRRQDTLAKGQTAPAIAFNARQDPINGPINGPIDTDGTTNGVMVPSMQVRRLTPTECERLMGFPDGYTAVTWRGKTADDGPDGPRYKALGNSWATNCARWVGRRIALVDSIRKATP